MKAVLHTGPTPAWAQPLERPWPLLPIGNRPWAEYWIEWLVAQDIRELHLVLVDEAYAIEHTLGSGSRWGVTLHYHFLREPQPPEAFLRRDPQAWRNGLFWIRLPAFPRRHDDQPPLPLPPSTCVSRHGSACALFCSRDAAAIDALPDGRLPEAPGFDPACLQPEPIASLADYFALNMAMVRGESTRYLTPGYRRQDRAYLGYNVVYPASARLSPPLMIGNDVRLRDLCTLGPDLVVGNRVIIDRQAEAAEAVVLDGTYVGCGVEIRGRIAAGRRLIDPAEGTVLDLNEDIHLLAPLRNEGSRGEKFRRLAHRAAGLLTWLAAAPLAVPLLALGMLSGGRFRRRSLLGVRGPLEVPHWKPGRLAANLIARLSLHEWPLLLRVLSGDLWLSGQLPVRGDEEPEARSWPAYRPGLFTYADRRPDRDDPVLRRIEAAYYAHHRGWREDARIWMLGWWGRLAGCNLASPALEHEGVDG